MALAKEQIRQIITENNFTNVTDVYAYLKEGFKDILQEDFLTFINLEEFAEVVELNGKKLDKDHTPRKAIQAGIALVPEDRAQQGMIGDYAVRENISSIDIQKAASHGVLRKGKEDRLAEQLVKTLDVRPADIHYPMTGLSGGNQQKVVVGKWLTHDYGVYLMDEVTSGVDIEAKAAIYTIMGDIVKKGGAVLNSTGDIEEALGVSDRILVLFKGKVILETTPDKTSKEQLLAYIMGGEASA